jgi:hypothetical protein
MIGKIGYMARYSLIIILFALVSITGCLPPQGSEIPIGIAPQRDPTYDDIINCGPGVDTYRANCNPRTTEIRESDVVINHFMFPARIQYRNFIETRAGEVRYNCINVIFTNIFLKVLSYYFYSRIAHSALVNYDVRLVENSSGIQVRDVGRIASGISAGTGDVQINLMLTIPPELNPGDYILHFIATANGFVCGELPCTIHVIE